jgi:hypothetical protein
MLRELLEMERSSNDSPLGTVDRILNRGFLRWCLFTSQLIKVYNRMTNAVRRVAMKKMSFWWRGHFFAENWQANLIAYSRKRAVSPMAASS